MQLFLIEKDAGKVPRIPLNLNVLSLAYRTSVGGLCAFQSLSLANLQAAVPGVPALWSLLPELGLLAALISLTPSSA